MRGLVTSYTLLRLTGSSSASIPVSPFGGPVAESTLTTTTFVQRISHRTACSPFVASGNVRLCPVVGLFSSYIYAAYSAYLLIYGALPTKEQFKTFQSEVMHHGVMHSEAEGFFRSFR